MMMSQATEPRVIVRIEDREAGARVAHVVINNARKLNTLNSPLMADFVAAFETLSHDAALRCVVLTGAGDRAPARRGVTSLPLQGRDRRGLNASSQIGGRACRPRRNRR